MKIGLVVSGNDGLALFKFLQKYNHEYVVFYDDLSGAWGDLSQQAMSDRLQLALTYLGSQNVDKIILAPLQELLVLQSDNWVDYQEKILPLFSQYVLYYCFGYSLIGKIGFFGDYLDIELGQKLLQKVEQDYQLSDHQKSIQKFQKPLTYWGKEVGLWKSFLRCISFSNYTINRVVKTDLKYFKDANVDTIIPFNYGYFWYQKTIKNFFNFNKTRFHTLENLEEIFLSFKLDPSDIYSIQIAYTDHGEFLNREKKIMWMLQRGKEITVIFNRV